MGYTRRRITSGQARPSLTRTTTELAIDTSSNDFAKRFAGKTAFITGGAGGIGVGMAKAFAEQGMNVVVADIAAEPLAAARQELLARGADVLAIQLDVTDRAACKAAAAQAVAHFGGVHLVCANAGVAGFIGPLQESSDLDWDWILDVNLRGSINTVQAFLPYLLNNAPGTAATGVPARGHIVLTSSISGLRVHKPSRGQGMYNTTKYALVGYGEALSVDLEQQGVGVSILCPGVVNTALSHSGEKRPEKYGGAFTVRADFELASLANHGTDPLQFGRWVRNAVERNQLFVITHTGDRPAVEERCRRVLQSFDDSAEITRS